MTLEPERHETLRAVFVGEGSLLLRCAEEFLAAGHQVLAICSANAALLQWAQSRGLPVQALAEAGVASKVTVPYLADVEFDYLFSIAHLRVLPAETLTRARRLAINFHDALLPDYPGLNATACALLCSDHSTEKTHGVTWHEMTPAVDAGRILRQQAFAAALDETALSLNAKCYEAGLTSFGARLDRCGGDSGLACVDVDGAGLVSTGWRFARAPDARGQPGPEQRPAQHGWTGTRRTRTRHDARRLDAGLVWQRDAARLLMTLL